VNTREGEGCRRIRRDLLNTVLVVALSGCSMTMNLPDPPSPETFVDDTDPCDPRRFVGVDAPLAFSIRLEDATVTEARDLLLGNAAVYGYWVQDKDYSNEKNRWRPIVTPTNWERADVYIDFSDEIPAEERAAQPQELDAFVTHVYPVELSLTSYGYEQGEGVRVSGRTKQSVAPAFEAESPRSFAGQILTRTLCVHRLLHEGGAPQVEPLSGPVLIPDGTPLLVASTELHSSNRDETGGRFTWRVMRPVDVDGNMVFSQGAAVHGVVADARSTSSFGGDGELDLRVLHVMSVSGEPVAVRSSLRSLGAPTSGEERIAKAVGNTVLGGGLGLLVAAGGEGRAVLIPSGTPIWVFVHGDQWIGKEADPNDRLRDPVEPIPE
jgi:hypothetical protein